MYSGYNRSGFDVDLYLWLGQHAEPPFTPVPTPIPVSDRIDAIRDGRAQIVVEAFSITDERRKSIRFAGPYLITKQGVMTRAGETPIENLAQLGGRTVCTLRGSTSLDQLNNGSLTGRITVTQHTAVQECVNDLLAGQVDAVSTDQLILYGFARRDPTHLSVVPSMKFGADERYGIGLPHDDVALCKELTTKLKEFVIDGYWEQFFKSNFGDLGQTADYKPDVDRFDRCDD